ncbi:MAG: sulfurtransferase FdhD, partial [Rhodoferax sp.]|nr:sulfurtransferase FdhD [Rhodoferax sp.]
MPIPEITDAEDLTAAPLVACRVWSVPPPQAVAAPHAGASTEAGIWRDDVVAAEVPVALVFNGISHAVMMATPADLHAFALGFALSEGIVDTPADVFDVVVEGTPAACEVRLEIASRCFVRLKEKRRTLAGRTGCGICGIDSLEALDIVPEAITPRPWVARLPVAAVLRAIDAMPAMQTLNAAAGAVHAAGWASPDGDLHDLLEDVGRHNALDKLLGRLALQGRLQDDGFVVMSSRASFELVRKCARLDIPVLATISAPTSLALDIAERAGLQLWGLCRPPRATRYVPADR